MKFGGTSVGDVERIKGAAAKVVTEIQRGHKVAVVVSAMAGVTDSLINYCRAVSPNHNPREHDAVVSTGEQVTAGLMAMALQQRGLNARSWQGWQVPLQTDSQHGKARVTEVGSDAIRKSIESGVVGVMAGFQGVSGDGSVTTLGRGGSDTSAVALAIALKADRCDIYTDVDGVYTSDPRVVTKARRMPKVSYEEMLELASVGAKVLQTRSVELAMRYRMPIQVLSTFNNAVGSEMPGTHITEGDAAMEQNAVTGIAHTNGEAKITLVDIPDQPGIAASVFVPLARAGINVDMIVQTSATDGKTTDVTFTVSKGDLDRARKVLESEQAKLGYKKLVAATDVTKVSLVGVGIRGHVGVAATMFETLAEKNINIQAIETSEISISVLIAEEYAELAVRALHTAYGLDKK